VKVIILAGGLGTRLQEETVVKPKPMVEVGGRPILWHILNIYAAHGVSDFVLALGYKGEVIKHYFHTFFHMHGDFSVDLCTGKVTDHDSDRTQWNVHLVDTGLSTQTGGRLARLRRWVQDGTFMMTYGDGVGNVDIQALLAFHRRHGKLATLTAVTPPARFGLLEMEGDSILRFAEKPPTGEGWISGGYFVLEPQVLDYIEGDETIWERGPLERLASEGQLMAYRHTGFWHPMDSVRDLRNLESLWQSGNPPWKIWT
jgi:glucose-1-phosphate cytidylyltransferase